MDLHVLNSSILSDDVILMILAYLPLKDKVMLHQQIPSWRHMTAYLLSKQRIISSGYYEDQFEFESTISEMNSIPKKWLKNETLSEWILLLEICPNISELYLYELKKLPIVQITNIVDHLLRKWTNLKSLAVDFYPTYSNSVDEKIFSYCLENKQLEFLSYSYLTSDEIKDIIDTHPFMKGIRLTRFSFNFVAGQLVLNNLDVDRLTENDTLTDLCLYFQSANSHYNKLCSNGMTMESLDLMINIPGLMFNEICQLFTELRYLYIQIDEWRMDIRQLQSLAELRSLHLHGDGALYVDNPPEYLEDEQIEVITDDDVEVVARYCVNSSEVIENICSLLPHLTKLENLLLVNVFVSDRTLKMIHEFCPHLRDLRIEYTANVRPVITNKSLTGVCQLDELIFFKCEIYKVQYIKWSTREVIENQRHNRLY